MLTGRYPASYITKYTSIRTLIRWIAGREVLGGGSEMQTAPFSLRILGFLVMRNPQLLFLVGSHRGEARAHEVVARLESEARLVCGVRFGCWNDRVWG